MILGKMFNFVIMRNATALEYALQFAYQSESREGNKFINTQIRFVCECLGLSLPPNHNTPWCSLGAAYAVILTNSEALPIMLGTINGLAKSWAKVGVPIEYRDGWTVQPKIGDLLIFDRGTNPMFGHIGFYLGETNGRVVLFGANQSDSWSISKYQRSKARFLVDPSNLKTTNYAASFIWEADKHEL